jgi:hypothetical protein
MLTVHQRPPIGGQWKRVTPAWRSFRPEPERDDFSRHNTLGRLQHRGPQRLEVKGGETLAAAEP